MNAKTKIVSLFFSFFFLAKSKGQDSLPASTKVDTGNYKPYKPEILTSGFIDVVNSGQVSASARFLRLYIGEPGRFSIPLSLYSGVSANNFQSQQNGSLSSNQILVSHFINPLSGLINVSVDNVLFLNGKKSKSTKQGILYHFGIKILTGYKSGLIGDPLTGSPVNFLNSFGSTGLYFQTGAWERSNKNNVGVFWMTIRFIACSSSAKQIEIILPGIKTNGIYTGYSFGCGIEINSLVNLKILYYKYIKAPENGFGMPIYQFSFNYSMK